MAVKKSTFGKIIDSKAPKAKRSQGSKTTMPLADIKDRPHGDTRALNDEHVQELSESIAAVGLIQPLAVDSAGHLLAGGHRRAALAMLQSEQPDRYAELFGGGVPVRRFGFDAEADPEQAIAIEAAENEKRRDYTPAEVRELADRLVEAGYKSTRGKPKKGEKALTPALMTIVGKSRKTVQRYLAPVNESPDPISKWERLARQLDKAADDPEAQAVARTLRNAAKKLRTLEDADQ